MAVRWIIGRAGTGKTALCVREMRAAMANEPLGEAALLWIVPEQATFSSERLLLTGNAPGLGAPAAGSFGAQVLSFRRLAMLVARETGILPAARVAATAMDDLARAVLLEEIVRRQRDSLRVFAGVADRPGFIEKLDGALRELRQHGHSAASLRAMVDGGLLRSEPGGIGGGGTLQLKLLDLADLLFAWEEALRENGSWDLEGLMRQAAAKVPECAWIAGAGGGGGGACKARVWVDAFSTMSTLEMRLLAALGVSAAQVSITLLADPEAPEFRALRASAGRDDVPLFGRTQRLHRRLTEMLGQHKVPIVETVKLATPHRFGTAALRRIESGLFAETAPVAEVVPEKAAAPLRSEAPKRKSPRRAVGPTLFDSLDVVEAPAGASPAARADGVGGLGVGPLDEKGATAVEIWETSDPETEVRLIAQAIRELVMRTAGEGGGTKALRYRNIGIVAPDLEGYQDALRRVLAEHNIPHFIDARRTIAHHPVVELLRSAVAIACNRWERDDLLLYLKTRLAGVSPDDVALLENYLIEHNITHVPWNGPWHWIGRNLTDSAADAAQVPLNARARLDRINAARAKVFVDLSPWMVIAGQGEAMDARVLVQGLADLLLRLGVEEQLQRWSHADGGALKMATAAEQAELAQIHQQAWREITRLLSLLETILAGKQRTLVEFERLLNSALENLTLGLIPPTVDQVLVSSVTRSRVPELEVVFLLGAVEGQLPKVLPEDPILSDAQREAFNLAATELGETADCIAEGTDRQLLEMPFFDYVAFTRAGRRLVVTYPVADRQGKAVTASRYIDRLVELLGSAVAEKSFDAASLVEVERVATRDDLLTAVMTWARGQITVSGHIAPGLPGETSRTPSATTPSNAIVALYDWLATTSDPAWTSERDQVWEAIRGKPEAQLAGNWAARFYPPGKPLYMSVTQLEKFATCPLQYFFDYTLKLRPREELSLDVMDMGVLYHSILERMYRRIIAGVLDWPQCDIASLRAALETEVDQAIGELHQELAASEPGYEKTRARIKRQLAAVMEADRRRACVGALRPQSVELSFGRGGGGRREEEKGTVSLPVLRVDTPKKHTVHVNGKIDRVDADEGMGEEAAVIDYKSARYKRLDMEKVLEGLDLQLPVYAVVMRDMDHRMPLAALYLGLGMFRQRPAHAGEIKDDDAFYRQFKPRGMIEADRAFMLDVSMDTATKSNWYSMHFVDNRKTKERRLSEVAWNDLLSADDFATVLDYARWKIAQLADDLMAGVIAPQPYRKKAETPCQWCEFASLCPFDRVHGTYRELSSLKPAEAVAQMRERKGMF